MLPNIIIHWDEAKEIKDLITKPSDHGKYEHIKGAYTMAIYNISQEQQIRQLLEHEEMGNRRSSQFYDIYKL